MCPQLVVNRQRTLYGVDDGRKIDQEGIADGFDDVPVMSAHGLLNQLIMDIEQPQHAGFVRAHLAAEADNIGKHDCSEPSMLCACHAAGVVIHGRFASPRCAA